MKKKIGFIIPQKENENRRVLLPFLLSDTLTKKNNKYIFIESEYGELLGISDNDYSKLGVNISKRSEIFEHCDIICDLKIGSTKDQDLFHQGQIGFGWFHAIQGSRITNLCIEKKLTAIAWEEMFEDKRHVFWKNNQIAGKASIIDVMRFMGRSFDNLKVAVIGRGNTAFGALGILNKFSADIKIYTRQTIELLRKEIQEFDVIVNCVLWDPLRTDRILYREDIRNMKKNGVIIDISCNLGMEIESSHPTSIANPVYYEEGILHYVVDHTPSLLFRESSESISKALLKYLNILINNIDNDVIKNATIIKNGYIIDNKISEFQKIR